MTPGALDKCQDDLFTHGSKPLPKRLRKLLGTLVLVTYVIVYCLLVMKLASATLPNIGGWGHLGFYVFFGLIWVVPAAVIVWWMQRPGAQTG